MAWLSFPAWCGSQGITAIEVAAKQFPSWDRQALIELQRACEHAGVTLACLAIDNDFTLPNDDQRLRQVERTRQLLYDVAVPLKIPVMRVCMGLTDTSRDGDQRALDAFRGLVPDLEATKVLMALENHSRVQTTPEQMLAIIDGVPTPLFGSCLDFGSLPSEHRLYALELLAPVAKYVHASSSAFNAQGEETTIDYQAALATLGEFGYDGVIAIEYAGQGDAAQGVLQTKRLINKYWYMEETGGEQQAA
jgi:sugar phosphate isomerase/epimerase